MSLSTKLVAGALALGLSACALGAAERVPSLADPSNPGAPESPVHGMAAILANDASAFSSLEEPSGGAAPHSHSHGGTEAGTSAAAVYTCPMHPEVTSPEPGRCPKCGMNLVLREPNEAKPTEAAPSGGPEHSHGHEGHP
ncbi:heavy metal-binding domain-containing protein [Archangium sp.]|uniref:heavy metal-binding domain-containing protein n=1 Tax=Archangium sp. TaxID=1872627 RepID=UPI00389A4E8E